MQLLVTLGTYHREDSRYQKSWDYWGAVLQVLDTETGEVLREVGYEPPPEHLGGSGNLLFMGAHVDGALLHLTTKTEVLTYDRETLEPLRVFSYPYFNDLHSVVRHRDLLAVANTGRETVQLFDLDGTLRDEVDLSSQPAAERFDESVDYRLQRDTKPHEVHPNQVFVLKDELWCTRLNPRDAVCLADPARRFEIPQGGPHDGHLREGKLWFTTTNGYVVALDPKSGEVAYELDVGALHPEGKLAGWCRGVEVSGDQAFVGFTCLRETKHKRYKFWGKESRAPSLPSRIVQVDLARRELVRSFEIQPHTGASIYSVLAWEESV